MVPSLSPSLSVYARVCVHVLMLVSEGGRGMIWNEIRWHAMRGMELGWHSTGALLATYCRQ